MLFINPPVATPSEPPAGIARLAGSLREHGRACGVLDLNLPCLLAQFEHEIEADDRWSKRANKDRQRNITQLRVPELYRSFDRYQRVVSDLGRVLNLAGRKSGCKITLANYEDPTKTPLRSADLLASAEQFETNHFHARFSPLLEEALVTHQPEYVGLSFSYLSQALTGFAVAGFIRHHFPEIKIVAGGGLITTWMSNPAWTNPFQGLFDLCLAGYGEDQLLELFGSESRSGLGRLSYNDFSLADYLTPGVVLPYAASYGCYWQKCQFCPDFAEGSCYEAIPAKKVIIEIDQLIQTHKPVLVHLLDNAISPALLRHLADYRLGMPWYGFARFEKDLEDFDYCIALRRSGCVMLKLGLESGSARVLEQLDKGIDLEGASRILNNLQRAGIGAYVYLLFGTPAETESEALLTLEFVRTHWQAITFLNLAIFNMPVCSPEAADLDNRFSDGDLSLYCDFVHPRGWGRKAVRGFLQKRFRKDPLVQNIERRSPGVFGSNHAPFFLSMTT
ncbi:MAG: radical SAM protein [Desulfofustis sp.]|nr:radical SAM protein [Desulfofustis sp.]